MLQAKQIEHEKSYQEQDEKNRKNIDEVIEPLEKDIENINHKIVSLKDQLN